jgi:hypothetical protein
VKILSRVFRGKFCAGLKRLYRRKQLRCAGPASALANPKQFYQLLRSLHRQDWVVYAKPAFGGPMQVLRYLGRYTHRIVISNHRLLAFDGEHVTFRRKDYAHGGRQRKMKPAATEFLRRFFLHVLQKGLLRIRYFGFLSNRFRTSQLTLGRQLLAMATLEAESPPPDQKPSTWHCRHDRTPETHRGRTLAVQLLRFVIAMRSAEAPRCAPSTASYTCVSMLVTVLPNDFAGGFRSNTQPCRFILNAMPALSTIVGWPIIGFASTKAGSNPHSQRPAQTPAASF